MNSRYRIIHPMVHQVGRDVEVGWDRWLERPVVLKAGAISGSDREARCLLDLTWCAAPELLDVVRSDSDRLTLVLERLNGRTLEEAKTELTSSDLPDLVLAVCHRLIALHRAGWIHCDLKPQNILLLESDGGFDVRLLDFGFAIPRFKSWGDAWIRGGTPPYLAPELRKGWMVDRRADLYSLGIVLKELVSLKGSEPRWRSILERLTDPIPARRYQSVEELAATVIETFGCDGGQGDLPSWGTGAFHGREEILNEVVERLNDGERNVLVQARPGVGLSRFLLEAALDQAEPNSRAIQIIDLPSLSSEAAMSMALDRLEAVTDSGPRILCGIDDPSPGLHWSNGVHAERLRRLFLEPTWNRVTLPPLGPEAFREIAGACIDSIGEGVDLLAASLLERSEGDLQSAGDGFGSCIGYAGVKTENGWAIDSDRLREILGTWHPRKPEPSFQEIPATLSQALAICSRAGRSLPTEIGREVLRKFLGTDLLSKLIEHGYLIEEKNDRAAFVTGTLWIESRKATPPNAVEIDRWLCDHVVPDFENIDDLVHLCRLARSVGSGAKERQWLSHGLVHAEKQRRWEAILQLMAHPETEEVQWTEAFAKRQVSSLAKLLEPDWSYGRLLYLCGASIKPINQEIGSRLLREALEGNDPRGVRDAVTLLTDGLINELENEEFDRLMDRLASLDAESDPLVPGFLAFYRGYRLLNHGRHEEALALAQEAKQVFDGSGLIQEGFNLLLLAILISYKSPKDAVAMMESTLQSPVDPETFAQLSYNLSMMYEQMADFRRSLFVVDRALAADRSGVSLPRLIGLRMQRAWNLLHLDRVDRAIREVEALLRSPLVQHRDMRRVPVRNLLAYCHMARGETSAAIREVASNLELFGKGLPRKLQWETLLALVDIVLETNAWDFVEEGAALLLCPSEKGSPEGRILEARVRALVAQSENRGGDAVDILVDDLDAARGITATMWVARYLHHLALVSLAAREGRTECDSLPDPVVLLNEELEILPSPGADYYRASALHLLTKALWAAGRTEEAMTSVSKARQLAREIDARGLVKRCVETRARIQMGLDD